MTMVHFTFDEFFRSGEAVRRDIRNVPPSDRNHEIRINIMTLVSEVLDPVRDHVGDQVIITSGYRCEALNTAVGGVPNSQHMMGQAADFAVPGYTVKDLRELAFWMADNLDFDQVIVYANRGFIHTSYVSPGANRREVLFT